MKAKFIQVLPFYSKTINDSEVEPIQIGLWRCADNLCEMEGSSRCDAGGDLFYSVADKPAAFYCPRHWYELHTDACGYQLVDMTDADFFKASGCNEQWRWKQSQPALNKLEQAAALFQELGLQEEADKIQHTLGWVRANRKSHP